MMDSSKSISFYHRSLTLILKALILLYICALVSAVDLQAADLPFVRVSPRDPRYLELSDGSPYIPIGLNMIAPPRSAEKAGLADMEEWFKNLSANRGNFVRVWLSNPFWDIEHETSGVYDEKKAQRIDKLFALARQYNIRVKCTLEHFRYFHSDRKSWAAKSLHHVSAGGPAQNLDDFFQSKRCRQQFKRKIRWFRTRYRNNPTVFAWELWNEMDCVRGQGWLEWTEIMLAELHRQFPHHLALQSLGSFDNDSKRNRYRRVCLLPDNDIAQVHRYLDLGAQLKICHGPVDVLAAAAVRELHSYKTPKPILLAESGAVEPGHTGPFKLYAKDKAGIILHDVLFAPFFAGAAGAGQNWHWNHYVAKNNLWFQFHRFAEAVQDLDPPAEQLESVFVDHPQVRVYFLKGKHTLLAWCRDKKNSWRMELAEGVPPKRIRDIVLNLPEIRSPASATKVQFYDPWTDQWQKGRMGPGNIALPEFTRSLVIKIRY